MAQAARSITIVALNDLPCIHCSLTFDSPRTLAQHRASGHCLSESSMWSTGYHRTRPNASGRKLQGRKIAGVWSLPVRPLRPVKPVDEESTYKCVLCKKVFADHIGFNAHHILKFTPRERCLDGDELTALEFKQSRAGVYGRGLFTQVLSSQIARLATLRRDSEALNKATGY